MLVAGVVHSHLQRPSILSYIFFPIRIIIPFIIIKKKKTARKCKNFSKIPELPTFPDTCRRGSLFPSLPSTRHVSPIYF